MSKLPLAQRSVGFIFSGRLLLVIESKRARGVIIMAFLYVRSAQAVPRGASKRVSHKVP